ncbi:hypothetical protein VT03_02495 [Planctomyces sp. SH-PL14]|nr:hypothetical protein VT03_02495 [Planctomyces sp. SH-PL14]
MLLSMTGFGDGRAENERLGVLAEIRCVNNRHLKVTIRSPENCGGFDTEIERIVRQGIVRGTVTVTIRTSSRGANQLGTLNTEVLTEYWKQLHQWSKEMLAPIADASHLLALPGVVAGNALLEVSEEDWSTFETALNAALTKVQSFRATEGKAMRDEMARHCDLIEECLGHIITRAPLVVIAYRDKIKQRVNDLLKDSGVTVSDVDFLREVNIFADRCDITEEIARLKSHIDQFRHSLDAHPSAGRKLEFLCQEIFREINTIGSKANDVTIAHHAVDAKTSVEKIREIVQNVE